MLVELRAENYAVIDHAIAVFGPGLNLLTGETGAGKSILVDALALLMGGKGSTDIVRHGADRAVISCVFEATAQADAILEENGLDSTGTEIILRREILSNGKGRVFVNNQPATVAVLKLLAPELALVHAQSETLSSFDQAQQRLLLDRFAGIETHTLTDAYHQWQAAARNLAEMEQGEQDRVRMVDLWSYQRSEIESANLTAEEDVQLENEKRVLANAEKLYAAAQGAFDQLYDGSASAESALLAAQRNVEELARYDSKFATAAQDLAGVRATVGDLAATLRDYAETVGDSASPDRLAEIEDRLAALDRLKRKYALTNGGIAEVIAHGEDVAAKLAQIDDREAVLKKLRVALGQTHADYVAEAESVSSLRVAAAAKLAQRAERQINDLAMKVRFEVTVSPQQQESAWSTQGWDAVEYRIATNAGEPLKPLEEIASGGEMSRVMLALKVSVEAGLSGEGSAKASKPAKEKGAARIVSPRTLVFDEIDIGIGGRAAEAVGHKLKVLSRAQQILCVTHLPQIAAFADQHFVIEKTEAQGRTKTNIRLLDDRTRVEEVARMLSGAVVTEASQQHASQMIEASR